MQFTAQQKRLLTEVYPANYKLRTSERTRLSLHYVVEVASMQEVRYSELYIQPFNNDFQIMAVFCFVLVRKVYRSQLETRLRRTQVRMALLVPVIFVEPVNYVPFPYPADVRPAQVCKPAILCCTCSAGLSSMIYSCADKHIGSNRELRYNIALYRYRHAKAARHYTYISWCGDTRMVPFGLQIWPLLRLLATYRNDFACNLNT